jgi:hypothetical protein
VASIESHQRVNLYPDKDRLRIVFGKVEMGGKISKSVGIGLVFTHHPI